MPPAQLNVVKALQPNLVTVTIGGNDLDFASIAQTCLAASPAGPLFLHPTFASCPAYFASSAGSADNHPTHVSTLSDPGTHARIRPVIRSDR